MPSNTSTTKPGDPPPDPPAPLLSAWRVRADAGEPIAVVRVRNLQGALPVGRDAWGRPGRLQPVLLSSEVSFARPFAAASADDRLGAETVHYGNLSKALLGGLELCSSGGEEKKGEEAAAQDKDAGGSGSGSGSGSGGSGAVVTPSSSDVFELLWVRMTGRVVDGSRVELPPDQVPFLDAARLRSLSLSIQLPKASLLGAGVSLTTTTCFSGAAGGEVPVPPSAAAVAASKNPLRSYSRSLQIRGLHVPTLIGVNANERAARQMVVADVEIDRYDAREDIHADIERTVVEAMESSSFETLEALATYMANKILFDFRIGDDPKSMKERGWQVKVVLEKPIAVPFAECPMVEVKLGADLP
ncbi:hypothetical protein SLS62_005593 [Diatrype stigma]|uniref:Dihydroneopterin aldolase/epimerase domain-containing protein n=1 Tax=Diatrype stigma TaxID=117547 RepID=A0AAN9UUL0_9PEZI